MWQDFKVNFGLFYDAIVMQSHSYCFFIRFGHSFKDLSTILLIRCIMNTYESSQKVLPIFYRNTAMQPKFLISHPFISHFFLQKKNNKSLFGCLSGLKRLAEMKWIKQIIRLIASLDAVPLRKPYKTLSCQPVVSGRSPSNMSAACLLSI